jgi:hypothetical protein
MLKFQGPATVFPDCRGRVRSWGWSGRTRSKDMGLVPAISLQAPIGHGLSTCAVRSILFEGRASPEQVGNEARVTTTVPDPGQLPFSSPKTGSQPAARPRAFERARSSRRELRGGPGGAGEPRESPEIP